MSSTIDDFGGLKFVGITAILVALVAMGAAEEHNGGFADIFGEPDQEQDVAIVVGEDATALDVVGGIDIAHAVGSAQTEQMDEEINETNETEDDLNGENDQEFNGQDDLNGENDQEFNGQDDLNDVNDDRYVGALDSDDNIQQRTQEETIILIGGPNVNELTRELSEQNQTRSAEEYSEGEAYIEVIPDGFAQGYDVMVVSGYEGEDTREAARYLVDNPEEIESESTITVPTQ